MGGIISCFGSEKRRNVGTYQKGAAEKIERYMMYFCLMTISQNAELQEGSCTACLKRDSSNLP
jgi:hypothetical protein